MTDERYHYWQQRLDASRSREDIDTLLADLHRDEDANDPPVSDVAGMAAMLLGIIEQPEQRE